MLIVAVMERNTFIKIDFYVTNELTKKPARNRQNVDVEILTMSIDMSIIK